MLTKTKQKLAFVSNKNKSKYLIKLDNLMNLGYLFIDKQYVPEAGKSDGGVIYIFEKNEKIPPTN